VLRGNDREKVNMRLFAVLALALLLAVTAVGPVRAEPRASSCVVVNSAMIRIGRDVVISADEVVHGDLLVVGGDLRIDGTVDGDVAVLGGDIHLGPSARVQGDVACVGGEVHHSPGAQVEGELVRVPPAALVEELFRWRWPPAARVLQVLGLWVLGVLILVLFPHATARVRASVEREPARAALVGLAAHLLLIPLSILLAVTLVGIPLVPVVVIALLVARLLGYLAVSLYVGGMTWRALGTSGREPARVWQLVLGMVLLGTVQLLPVAGWLISIAVALVGSGAALLTRWGTRDGWPWTVTAG